MKPIYQFSFLWIMLLSISNHLLAQAPQKINYQGVARNATGAPLASTTISLKISILHGSAVGAVEYSETHAVTTNSQGLYTLAIGGGSPVTGSMSSVVWSTGDKYIKVEIDPSGGSSFVTAGTSQLLSVPFALYSANGPAGPQGPAGPAGATGPAGPIGATGPAGPIGATGPAGPIGATGPAGPIGATGPAGPIGATGLQGPAGPIGATGPAGPIGATGLQGPAGPIGATGPAGPAGPAGSGISGGTVNMIPKYSSATSLVSSSIVDDGAGFVGINTNLPIGAAGLCYKQTVSTIGYGGMNISTSSSTGRPFISFGNNGNLYGWIYSDGTDNNKLKINNGGLNIVSILPTGQVGIGTTTPHDNVSIENEKSTVGKANLTVAQIGSSGFLPCIKMINRSATHNVGLFAGTTSLSIADSSGVTWASVNASAFNVLSDRTMKYEISTIGSQDYNDYLDQIRKIESATYYYNWENEGNRKNKHVGFIAQTLPKEIQTQISERPGESNGNLKIGYNLSDMAGLTLIGIKAIDEKTTELQNKIDAQDKLIQSLLHDIQELKSQK